MSPPRHRIIRAETDTWQLVRFQFKERDQTSLFHSASFFAYRTPHLLQHFLFTWHPHDQADRAAQKLLLPTLATCRALSTRHPLLW